MACFRSVVIIVSVASKSGEGGLKAKTVDLILTLRLCLLMFAVDAYFAFTPSFDANERLWNDAGIVNILQCKLI